MARKLSKAIPHFLPYLISLASLVPKGSTAHMQGFGPRLFEPLRTFLLDRLRRGVKRIVEACPLISKAATHRGGGSGLGARSIVSPLHMALCVSRGSSLHIPPHKLYPKRRTFHHSRNEREERAPLNSRPSRTGIKLLMPTPEPPDM